MIFSAENYSDLKKYFQGTYVKFPMAPVEGGGTITADTVHAIDEVRQDIIRGRLWAQGEGGKFEEMQFQFFLYSNEQMAKIGEAQPEVEFILPRKSYFNHEGFACQLYRVPARQYHRGVTGENTIIKQLSTAGGFDPLSLKFPVLHAYVAKQAFGSITPLISGSRALSPRIAYSADGKLFADQVRIGSINFEDHTVTVNSPLFVPELTKLSSGYEVRLPSTPKKDKKVSGKGYVAKKMAVEEYNEVI